MGVDFLVLLLDIDGFYMVDLWEDFEVCKLIDIFEIIDDILVMVGEGNVEVGVGMGGMIIKLVVV